MKVSQREIVEVNFPMPNGRFLVHPIIVLSVQEVFEAENFFYGVMLSTKPHNSEFMFELLPEMLTQASEKKSFVKCQLIDKFWERDVISKHGSIKQAAFKELLSHLNGAVFGNECK